ncbi:MAG: hypothetical protein KGJ13_12195 [Patescibacteria group bacterium]|nr:hypothetical protein [Patescibacteria group bacterium]
MYFKSFQDGVEFEPAPIYPHDLTLYKRDNLHITFRNLERKLWFKALSTIFAFISFPFFKKKEIGLLLATASPLIIATAHV